MYVCIYYVCIIWYIAHILIYRCVYVLYIYVHMRVHAHTHSRDAVWTSSLIQLPDCDSCQLYMYISVYVHCLYVHMCVYYCICIIYVGSVQLGTQPLFSILHKCHNCPGREVILHSPEEVPEGQRCAAKYPTSHRLEVGRLRVEPRGLLTAAHTLLGVILTSNADRKGPDLKEEVELLPCV